MDYADARQAAIDLARAGSRIAMSRFRRDVQARLKADGTWVTEADWAVEAQIRLLIARSFPDHNVLGEEEGLTASGGGVARPNAPTWVIDPIDGTNNFMAGIPIWATLVALTIEGEAVVGACHAPALDEMYDAALGAGACLNGRSIRVDSQSDLSKATVLFADFKELVGDASGFWADLARSAWRSRGFGDFWGHMLVARGAAHVMAERELSLWDVAALRPIVAEAGGKLTTLDGSRWGDGSSCLTTNAALHDQVTALARRHGAR